GVVGGRLAGVPRADAAADVLGPTGDSKVPPFGLRSGSQTGVASRTNLRLATPLDAAGPRTTRRGRSGEWVCKHLGVEIEVLVAWVLEHERDLRQRLARGPTGRH